MKGQVRQRIESLERELQGLKDELQPEIEVGSWWESNVSGRKLKVTKVDDGQAQYTYEDEKWGVLESDDFVNTFTPCEAPAKETWYLCTEDYESGGGADFKRGQEYKQTDTSGLSIQFEINGGLKFINRPTERGIMVSPQER
jgi:hypothetical protein